MFNCSTAVMALPCLLDANKHIRTLVSSQYSMPLCNFKTSDTGMSMQRTTEHQAFALARGMQEESFHWDFTSPPQKASVSLRDGLQEDVASRCLGNLSY